MNSILNLSRWGRAVNKDMMQSRHKLKPVVDTTRWNVVRGDFVQVIQGPQSGEKGKILAVLRKKNKVIIEGVNLRSRTIKPKSDGTPGRKVMKPCTIHYSKVMLVDPTTGEPTKISRRFLEDGTKVRVSKKTGHIIPKPSFVFDRKIRSVAVGVKDTLPVDVHAVTFSDYNKFLPYIYETERLKLEESVPGRHM